jgi:UDP-N-acetylmuramate dehydrogenase
MEIVEHHSLKAHNTLALDQRARFFSAVCTEDELTEALAFARQHQLPWKVIGAGSNLVLSRDFPGLVIQNCIKGIHLIKEEEQSFLVEVGAGENWHNFVCQALEQGWHGLENLALIPGTVGAAPVQNIGAYGVELCDVFHSLRALDTHTDSWVTLDLAACDFSYRDSLFKKQPDRFVITRVCFRFQKDAPINIQYQQLADYLLDQYGTLETLTRRQILQAVVAIRSSKLPDPEKIPNVGSFFKNPLVSEDQRNALLKSHPQLVSYLSADRQYKLAAAWLIDQAGWKGKQRERVGVHQQQALVLVNRGNARGEDVLALAHAIQQDIKNRFAVSLEIEPVII